MKNILALIFIVPIVSFALSLNGTNVVVDGINLSLTGDIEEIIKRDSSFDVVLSTSSSLTITSNDRKDFGVITVGTTTVTEACNTSNSTAIFSSILGISTTTISIVGNCPAIPSSGGGGGGASHTATTWVVSAPPVTTSINNTNDSRPVLQTINNTNKSLVINS